MASPSSTEAAPDASRLAFIESELRAMSAKMDQILQEQGARIQCIDDKLDRLVRVVEAGVTAHEGKLTKLPDAICQPLERRWTDTSQVVDHALACTNARLDRIEKALDELPDNLRSTRQKLHSASFALQGMEGFWPTTAVLPTTLHPSREAPPGPPATNPPRHTSQRHNQHRATRVVQEPSYTTLSVRGNISKPPIAAYPTEDTAPPSTTSATAVSSFRATNCRTMWHLWFHGDPSTADGPLRHVVLDEYVGGSTRMQQSRSKVVMEALCQLGGVAADDVSAMSPGASNEVFDRAFHALLYENPEGNLAGAVGKLRPDKAESYMVATVYNVLVNERRKRKRDAAVEIHML
ncbi:hypothetical protein H310_03679 [Aphanomyces invadans]|uniref:Uncharacterized protein n=1 Tax=Aphanomyces invadans TaxID=157072 RepID=A0A024UIR9_9STRA|nr:hypothetical protein H310_03679 [Aphanomyces invadans]ETW06085.1 hypothetical protein H310_03679 [Aphanomyces invadans]|eukprot:XP_008865862.1 hypothetical protein H310_03679 [Aphanomyces invadans]